MNNSPKTILIVDDDGTVLEVLKLVLEHFGYVVYMAPDPYEALEMLIGRPDIDTIITDLHLNSSIDGIELAKKAKEHNPNLAIFIASGNTGSVDPKQIEAIGRCQLIEKPPQFSELRELLRAS